MKKVLTIAGSDCSGGAGIQADIKTIVKHNCYAMSVVTALTAQNTMGVYSTLGIDGSFVGDQLDSVFKDIYPDAVKIGMLLNYEIAKKVFEKLKEYNPTNVVFDPVMVSSSGRNLLDEKAITFIKTDLFKSVNLITPNIHEAEVLSNIKIRDKNDMLNAAKEISKYYNGYILIKGGHSTLDSDDLLYKDGALNWLSSNRIDNSNSHGTGCTLSSAIASNLALGYDMLASVSRAKEYISKLLNDKMDIGYGSGPLNHTL